MQMLVKIYRRNIYGIIGTLVFHILLFLVFILANVDIKGDSKPDEVIIEFPDILPEPEEEIVEQEKETENTREQTAQNDLTNVASNRLATENTTQSADEYIDDEFQKEIEAAKQLAADVNKQLSKKVVSLDDIKMPVETTEGMNPDSIKNIIYAGESNIVYFLKNRYHIRLPIPVYLAQGGGTVEVDIVVNQNGKVIKASAKRKGNIHDEQIYLYAETAAKRTVFNTDYSAPSAQKGTIRYTFVAQ